MLKNQEVKEENKEELFKLGPNLSCGKGNHYFVYHTANEIECTKCPVGYPVGPEINLKEGNVVIHGEELVI